VWLSPPDPLPGIVPDTLVPLVQLKVWEKFSKKATLNLLTLILCAPFHESAFTTNIGWYFFFLVQLLSKRRNGQDIRSDLTSIRFFVSS
jgi:hypothetical protein